MEHWSKRRWRLTLCALAAVIVLLAAAPYLLRPPAYENDPLLRLRYSAVDGAMHEFAYYAYTADHILLGRDGQSRK